MAGVASFNTQFHRDGVVFSPPSSRQFDRVSLVGSKIASGFSPEVSVLHGHEIKESVWTRLRPDSQGFEAHKPRSGVSVGHGSVGDISIIFPCSFAVGITQQYGIYVLLG